jgi:outer membrane protein assembly factor BamC
VNFSQATIVLLTAALISACAGFGKDNRYLDVNLAENLELPPDLSAYEAESRFDLPDAFSGDDETERNRVPVLAKVDSLKLQGSGDFYWLSVAESADNLYRIVKNFWASEGYSLMVDEPVIGIMQTEWIYTEQGGSQEERGWLANLFLSDDLSATQDQFKTRIERDPSGNGSRIYVAHRGTEYNYVLLTRVQEDQGESQDEWRFRQPEPALEIEMLSRMMVYLGLQKAEVEQQIEDVKLFGPRASIHVDAEERSPFLIIRDPHPIAWNRVYHQLERMNFNIVRASQDAGIITEGIIVVKAMISSGGDSGGISFFSSDGETSERDIVLVLTEETHELTRVIIETAKGEMDVTPEGAEFLRLLFEKIK